MCDSPTMPPIETDCIWASWRTKQSGRRIRRLEGGLQKKTELRSPPATERDSARSLHGSNANEIVPDPGESGSNHTQRSQSVVPPCGRFSNLRRSPIRVKKVLLFAVVALAIFMSR